MNKIIKIGRYTEHWSRGALYDTKGIAPTLTSTMGMGGNNVPLIREKVDEEIHRFESGGATDRICPVPESKI